jgi:hypothetical protein
MKTDLTEYPSSFFSSQLLWLDEEMDYQSKLQGTPPRDL